ncbi:translation initiation factor IF-2-like [Tachyglossus aculeatus]|uniref:translation initiation factor IF-2-like n=1 Tax=Tachyglossus aculeatus TaxID=9261 RepID=UPI0018F47D26|nr:translation initiation factor IF-2-like [Tachyglossus aculeatus]
MDGRLSPKPPPQSGPEEAAPARDKRPGAAGGARAAPRTVPGPLPGLSQGRSQDHPRAAPGTVPGPLPGLSQGRSQDHPRAAPGTVPGPLPGPSQGRSQDHTRITPGPSQDRPRTVPASSQDRPRIVPGQSQDHPRTVPGSSRDCPRIIPGPSRDRPGTVPGSSQDRPGIVLGSSRDCSRAAPGTVPGSFLARPRALTVLSPTAPCLVAPRPSRPSPVTRPGPLSVSPSLRPARFPPASCPAGRALTPGLRALLSGLPARGGSPHGARAGFRGPRGSLPVERPRARSILPELPLAPCPARGLRAPGHRLGCGAAQAGRLGPLLRPSSHPPPSPAREGLGGRARGAGGAGTGGREQGARMPRPRPSPPRPAPPARGDPPPPPGRPPGRPPAALAHVPSYGMRAPGNDNRLRSPSPAWFWLHPDRRAGPPGSLPCCPNCALNPRTEQPSSSPAPAPLPGAQLPRLPDAPIVRAHPPASGTPAKPSPRP